MIWAKRPPESSFTEIYPQGRQWAYAPVIDGNDRIYDPRDGSRKYTNNAALVIADWVVNSLGGEVDWDEVTDEANASDVGVTNAEGEIQPRWTINGTVSDEQDYEDQRAQLAAACDAFFYERTDGKVGFTVGRWIAPTLTLTADDFYSFELTEGQWGADAPDEVAVTYTEPENAWRETPAGTWVENAVPKPVREEPQIFMISNHNQATRIGKRIARMRRAKYQLRATIGLAGYELLGGRDGGRAHRFFRVVHPEMGIDQTFEVGELSRDGTSMFTLTANSVKAGDFALNAPVNEPERPSYGQRVVSDSSIPVPSSFAGGALAQGTLIYTWAEQDAGYTQEVRYRTLGDTYWLSAVTATSADRLQISGFEDGAMIEAQIRNRTAGAGVSDWGPEVPVQTQVVVNPVAPGALTSFSVSDVGEAVLVSFTAPNDAQYFGTRIWRGATATFSSATLIHTEYGIPSDGDSFTDPTLTGAFYYWAAPINSSGVEGPLEGPLPITVVPPGP
ncbi:hypothetical protein ACFSZS_12440 [Seohaeicola zhoushanensis]